MWAPQSPWQQHAGQGLANGSQYGQLISGPANALVVAARQKLQTPEACGDFIESLLGKLDQFTQAGQKINFKDFDISQNKIPYDAWETLFTGLGAQGGRIERLRVFGCPTANDQVAALMAGWLANVTAETAPTELHLSDCAFTTDGFRCLMEAFEQNDAFPIVHGFQQVARPLYVRIENNYIEAEAIQEKIDMGIAIAFQKGPTMHQTGEGSGAKIKIMVRNANDFAQRKGTPPPPDRAPAPKQVMDRYGQQDAWNAQQPQAAARAHWQQPPPQQYWSPYSAWHSPQGSYTAPRPAGFVWPPAVARPPIAAAGVGAFEAGKGAGVAFARQQVMHPMHHMERPPYQATQARPRVVAPAAATAHAAALRATAVAADRSRSPLPKAAKHPGAGLPGKWEEHWSDEFGIPYYWNSETGDSMWEKPVEP